MSSGLGKILRLLLQARRHNRRKQVELGGRAREFVKEGERARDRPVGDRRRGSDECKVQTQMQDNKRARQQLQMMNTPYQICICLLISGSLRS